MRCILDHYTGVIEHEHAELFRVQREPWNLSIQQVSGILSGRHRFPMSQTELVIELAIMPPTGPRSLWVALNFFSTRGPETVLGSVGIRGVPVEQERDIILDFTVEARREPPAEKLPRGAERLTSRLRAQWRSKELLAYYDRRRQMVNTLFRYALRGEQSLTSSS